MIRVLRRQFNRLSLAAATLLFAVAVVPTATAGSFRLSPIYGEVPPTHSVITYTLSNPGEVPVTLQVEGRPWSSDGDDANRARAGHPDLVIVPRILTLKPGEKRPVRVALRRARTQEQAYRVVVQELPPPPPAGFVGMRAVIAQDVPLIFMVGGEPGRPAWTVRRQPDGQVMIISNNPGRRFLRVVDLALVDTRGAILAKRDGGAYLLAGQEQKWPLKTSATVEVGELVRLRYSVDGKAQEIPVTIQ